MSFPKQLVFRGGHTGDVYVSLERAAAVEFRYGAPDDNLRGVSVMIDGQRMGPFLERADAAHIEAESRRFQSAAQRRAQIFVLRVTKKK